MKILRKATCYGLNVINAVLTVLLVFSPVALPEPVGIQTTTQPKPDGNLEAEKQQWTAERQARAQRVQIDAPLWKIGEGFDSTLMINNTQPYSIDVDPILYRHDGTAVQSQKIHLKELESRTLSLGELIDVRQGYGQISLSFMGEALDIAAQIVIADQQRSLSFNHVFMGQSKLASSRFEGVFYLAHPGTRSELALANMSDEVVQVNVTLSPAREQAVKHPLSLAPHQTQVVNLISLLARPGQNKAVGIMVVHTGKGGNVLAQGIISDQQGYSANMRIVDPVVLKSSKLISPGLKLKSGLAPTLLLSNSSDNSADVAVIAHYNLRDEPYQTALATLSVPPHAADNVDLHTQVDALPAGATDIGLELQELRAGGLLADLLLMDSSGSDVIQTTPKDSIGEASLGHSLPYRIDGSVNTIITVANPSQTETIMYCLFIFYEGGSYTYEGKWLKPGQVVHVDIKELRDKQVPGELGVVIPKTVGSGQVKIKIHGPAGADRAIAEAVITDADGKVSLTMSCPTCPSDPRYVALSPTNVSGQLDDQSGNITPTLYYWDGSFKVILSPVGIDWFPANSSIADVAEDYASFKVNFKAAGVTTIDAQAFDCHYEINWLSEQCECTGYVYVAALVVIQVTSGCGDDRGNIVKEYRARNVTFRPTCLDFTDNASSTHFTFVNYNQNGYHAWAIVRNYLISNIEAVRNDWGQDMITTAGYRCPDKQNAIGWWEPSSHMRGNGMDFDTPDSPDDTVYNNLRTTAKNHNACVEPRAQSLNHIHIDWNDYTYIGGSPCLPGW